MSIDWTQLEDDLYSLCASDIKRFAESHRDEVFYGFALDCNSDYGDVGLCLNTLEDLHDRAIKYSTSPPNRDAWEAIERRMDERLGIPYNPRPLKSVEFNEQRLRWALGDWKYQGFNTDEFGEAWGPYQEAVSDATLEEDEDNSPTQVRFMQAACRVLVRLEAADVFSALSRTDDFKTWVADHDELDEDSWARLDAVRREMSAS